MATSAGQRIKAFLAAGEVAMKTANALDEHFTEFASLETRLHDLRNERTGEEQRLSDIRDEIVRTSETLRDEQVKLAAAQDQSRQAIGAAQEELRLLNIKIKEAQAKNDNLLEGFKALKQRLGAE